jgi:hypothetical protein
MERIFRSKRNEARSAIRATIAQGARKYERAMLSRLLPINIGCIEAGPVATEEIVKRLASALRSERARAGHWTYDLNRHIGLMQAHAAETARLIEEVDPKKIGRPKRPAINISTSAK